MAVAQLFIRRFLAKRTVAVIPRAHPKKMWHNAKMTGRILARELEGKCFGNTGKTMRNCVNF